MQHLIQQERGLQVAVLLLSAQELLDAIYKLLLIWSFGFIRLLHLHNCFILFYPMLTVLKIKSQLIPRNFFSHVQKNTTKINNKFRQKKTTQGIQLLFNLISSQAKI